MVMFCLSGDLDFSLHCLDKMVQTFITMCIEKKSHVRSTQWLSPGFALSITLTTTYYTIQQTEQRDGSED